MSVRLFAFLLVLLFSEDVLSCRRLTAAAFRT